MGKMVAAMVDARVVRDLVEWIVPVPVPLSGEGQTELKNNDE